MRVLIHIYRSEKKTGYYLYVREKENFSCVPEALLNNLGKMSWSMLIDLDKRQNLANADIMTVRSTLEEQGYYLQMPPLDNNDFVV